MRKKKSVTWAQCEAWCDRVLAEIADEMGVSMPEAREEVYAGLLPGLDSDLVWHQPKKPKK